MAQKVEVMGRKEGRVWDDGGGHEGIARIYVRGGREGIQLIKTEYVNNGQLTSGVNQVNEDIYGIRDKGFTQTFEINHLNNEHLECVKGYYDSGSGLIQAFQFQTNFRVTELIGYEKGVKFSLAVKGKRITGFHGYMRRANMASLGAYFTWITPSRSEAKGGSGGKQWDDGANHEAVTKIHVGYGSEGIEYIRFGYVESGKPRDGSVHGFLGRSRFTHTFEMKHVKDESQLSVEGYYNEYLLSVEGYYDEESGVIQALQFKTNIKDSELIGSERGKKFLLLAEQGKQIIGFHGYAEKNLNSLGVYFTTVSITKSICHRGTGGGKSWDDGAFLGVRKVFVRSNGEYVRGIRFEYDNGHTVVKRQHGVGSPNEEKEFDLSYPNELITSVEGTFNRGSSDILSLTFKTSKGTSRRYGKARDWDVVKFVLESKGCALVGFHGQYQNTLGKFQSLGAYFYPLYPSPLFSKRILARGSDQGASWDDGVFDGVTKIYIGKGDNGIAFLKFVYDKETRVVLGDDHGSKTLLEVKELELEYPSEYITAVEGCYDRVNGSRQFVVITMLTFKTNKRISIPVGFESSYSFQLHKEGYKIVGFHGKASHMIHQLGVHVVPINT